MCRRFNECTRCPLLWKKVDVKFSWHHGCQNEVVSYFSRKLCSSVTYMKLDFDVCNWLGEMNFEEFCVKLKEKCPHLHTLILHNALFSVSLPSVINLCSEFLGNLRALILTKSEFHKHCPERNYDGIPIIEILDISECLDIGRSSMQTFSRMTYLKKLNLSGTEVTDYWFWSKDDLFFLHQLELLHLGDTEISHETFHKLQKYAVNLTELYLCWARLYDEDFCFSNSVFPRLKTICIKFCSFVTCDGIISLIQSCQSLQNVYVDKDVAESYAKHDFSAANMSKLEIVKTIDNCDDHEKLDFLLQ